MKIIGPDGNTITLEQLVQLRPFEQPTITTEETRPMASDPQIVVTRLRLNHFRGWDQVDVEVGPGGTIFRGKEATGKSSFLFAIKAAIEAEGIGAEVLRFDAPEGGVLLDMVKVEQARRTAMQIKRTIKRKGSSKIELLGSDGVPYPQPKAQIDAMFEGRRLDPLEVYKVITDAKKLRQLIMEANPVALTSDDLNKWCETEQEWNTDGHGQEVLTRVREMYEGKRTVVGRACDQAKAAVAIKAGEVDKLRVEKPEAMTPEAARTHVAAAERELAVLRDRRRQASERDAAAEGTRARVAELRAHAEELMGKPEATPPEDTAIAKADGWVSMLTTQVQEIEKTLAEARRVLDEKIKERDAIHARVTEAAGIMADVERMISQAAELEQSIAPVAGSDPQDLAEQITAAEGSMESAQALVTAAEATGKWRSAKQELSTAEATQKTADDEWTKLDRIVKRLSKDAPSELAKRSDMIEGLDVTPDAVLLDGRNVTVLSGSERMKFSVKLAKRIAGKAKILTVDGMEAISPAEQPAFVRECLDDGWVLFATVVADGPLQIVDAYTFAGKTA
jgi:hypothetical protein